MKLEWHIEKRKVSDLKNWDKNPRKITEEGFNKLKERITKRGFHDVVKIDTNNEILSGNQRKRALLELGIEEVDCMIPDRPLTEEERSAVALESNRNDGQWDFDMLGNNYDVNFLMDVGFTDQELGLSKSKPRDEDEIPVVPRETSIKIGDMYQLGVHTILCGDSTKAEDVNRLMSGKKADMVFTDPPYNLDYKGMQNSKQWEGLKNDFLDTNAFIAFLFSAFSLAYEHTTDSAAFYICHADKTHSEFRRAFESAGLDWRATIIWVKNTPAFNFAQYKYMHEPIFYCFKRGQTVTWFGDNTKRTVWNETWDDAKIINWIKKELAGMTTTVWEAKKETGDHPTIKPTELIIKALRNSTEPRAVVYDPFLGSGSTIIASEISGRACMGIEIEPVYIDVIIKRWEEYTGKKAVKI